MLHLAWAGELQAVKETGTLVWMACGERWQVNKVLALRRVGNLLHSYICVS